MQVAENTIKVKEIITTLAKDFQAEAIFTPKPYEDQPGSGLHVHISLLQKDGINPLTKYLGEQETEIMQYAIGGMLATMKESMIFFAPFEESYKRFSDKVFNKKSETYNNAPTHICWGGNNRTVAVRIPTSTLNPVNRHMEHRVAAPDAQPYMVLAAIMAGVHYGIQNKISPGEKTWGNAYDKQYKHEPLPRSLEEAKQSFDNSKIINNYLGK